MLVFSNNEDTIDLKLRKEDEKILFVCIWVFKIKIGEPRTLGRAFTLYGADLGSILGTS